jgi:hypothetical protein
VFDPTGIKSKMYEPANNYTNDEKTKTVIALKRADSPSGKCVNVERHVYLWNLVLIELAV